MKNYKRIFSVLLVLILCVFLCACNEDKPKDDPDNPPVEKKNYSDTMTFVIPDKTGTFTASGELNGQYYVSDGENFAALINDNNELCYIKVSYIKDSESVNLSPSYLDKNVKVFKNLEFPGTVQVGENGIYAEMVAGFDGTQYVEAYLIDTDTGVLCVLISSTANDSTLSVLRTMVENFSIA